MVEVFHCFHNRSILPIRFYGVPLHDLLHDSRDAHAIICASSDHRVLDFCWNWPTFHEPCALKPRQRDALFILVTNFLRWLTVMVFISPCWRTMILRWVFFFLHVYSSKRCTMIKKWLYAVTVLSRESYGHNCILEWYNCNDWFNSNTVMFFFFFDIESFICLKQFEWNHVNFVTSTSQTITDKELLIKICLVVKIRHTSVILKLSEVIGARWNCVRGKFVS